MDGLVQVACGALMMTSLFSKLCRLGVLSAILDACQMTVKLNAIANTNRYFTEKPPELFYGGEINSARRLLFLEVANI